MANALTKVTGNVIDSTTNITAGIITATSFVGSGANLTGVASTDNIRTNTNATFLQNINVTGIVTAAGVNASGVITATSSIVGSAVTINASGINATGVITATSSIVGSAVTINASGINATGVITATSFSGSGANLTGLAATANVTTSSLVVIGVSTVAAGTTAAPSITPTGDSNTGIFFPSADTVAFAEGGAEALRIDSSGNLKLSTAATSILNSSGNKILNQTGSILQVVSTQYETATTVSQSATTHADMPFSVNITPTTSTSLMLVSFSLMGETGSEAYNAMAAFARTISGTRTVVLPSSYGSRNPGIVSWNDTFGSGNDNNSTPGGFYCHMFPDSGRPANTNTITYTPTASQQAASTFYLNRTAGDTNNHFFERGISWITVMEVAA